MTQHTAPRASPPSARSRWSRHAGYAPGLVFAGIALVTLAIAMTWPATYTSDAVIVLEAPPGADSTAIQLPSADRVAALLHQALVSPRELGVLAQSLGREPAQVAAAVRVSPVGSRTFQVTFSGSAPARVQQIANQLAERLVLRAPEVLSASGPSNAADLLRQRERELAEFTQANPDIALGAASPAASAARPASDPSLDSLRSEQARLERELRERTATGAPNPYASDEERRAAERRLTEIQSALRTREKALGAAPGGPTSATGALRAKWHELVDRLAEARRAAETPGASVGPRLTARISARAPLPASPATPNRLLIVAIGLVTAAGASALWFPVSGLLARNRSTSSAASAAKPAGATQDPSMVSPKDARPPESPKPDADATAEPRREPTLRRLSSQPPPGAGAYSMSSHDRADVPTADFRPMNGAREPDQSEAELIPRRGRAPATLIGGTRIDATVRSSTPPQDLRAEPMAAAPSPEPRRTAEAEPNDGGFRATVRESAALVPLRPYRSSEPAGTVTPYPVASGWRPDSSLSPADWLNPLRDELYRRALDRCFVVAVVALPDAELLKSKIAAQLALTLAETRQPRVLLLESDFDYPSVHRWMRVQMRPGTGFSQQMRAHIRGEAPGFSIMQCSPSLFVLGEGRIRSPGLLRSLEFEHAVNELRNHHELIVIDAPTASLSTEFRALDGVADAVLLVVPNDEQGANALKLFKPIYGDKILAAVVPPGADGAA